MSLYKTQRCRHFDDAGVPIKPYCSQGNKCRFIHPNDHQWTKLKRKNDDTPSPPNRDAARSRSKNKPPLFSASPLPRQHSSPMVPQSDLPKRRQRDLPREHDYRDWPPRRGSDSWGVVRERSSPFEHGFPPKRTSNEDHPYPNQRPRLSEGTLYRSASGGGSNNTRQAVQTDKVVPHVPECDSKTKTNVSDTFHRLAKLCCEIVQDSCFLDREQDKLKAFTGLSSELSRAVPDAAMAVTPALATVINGHTRTRERLTNHMEELEALWKTLFSVLESDISKIIDSRLQQAMATLDKGRDNALRAVTHSQKLVDVRQYDGTTGPRQWIDRREAATDKNTAMSQRSSIPIKGGATLNVSPEETHHREGSTSLPLAPIHEVDLGVSIRIVLEDMKMQMDRQTRAIELLAMENNQLKSASERGHPQLVPLESSSSSPRKPPVL